jgi:hypothetical protein
MRSPLDLRLSGYQPTVAYKWIRTGEKYILSALRVK